MPDADKDPTVPARIPSAEELKATLAKLQGKLSKLVQDFAAGSINRSQFHELYGRYQRQMAQLTQLASEARGQQGLHEPQQADPEDTFLIKKRLMARVLGVSIYANKTGLPIETLGDFAVDAALLVPMLSSYRDATREIFKAGMRSTVMENGHWLCFVPGNLTTLIALYTMEASALQISALEAMHRDFETANKAALEKGNADPSTLAYPFLTFIQQAKSKNDALKTATQQMPEDH